MGVLEGHCLRGHPDREPGFQVFRSGAQLDPGWPWVEGLCLSGHLLETDIPRTYQPFLVHNCSKTPLLLILQKKKGGGGRGRQLVTAQWQNKFLLLVSAKIKC